MATNSDNRFEIERGTRELFFSEDSVTDLVRFDYGDNLEDEVAAYPYSLVFGHFIYREFRIEEDDSEWFLKCRTKHRETYYYPLSLVSGCKNTEPSSS